MDTDKIKEAQRVMCELNIKYLEQIRKMPQGEKRDKLIKLQSNLAFVDMLLIDLEHELITTVMEIEKLKVENRTKDLQITELTRNNVNNF